MSQPHLEYSKTIQAKNGNYIITANDLGHDQFYKKTGATLMHNEIEYLCQLFKFFPKDTMILDIGANLGLFSVPISKFLQTNHAHAKILSFEPQRLVYNMLSGNAALNNCVNLFCHHIALGDQEGWLKIPPINYGIKQDFGQVKFGNQTFYREKPHNAAYDEWVEVKTIDSLNLPRVDFIKIDVEGMETKVLDGARKLIERDLPYLWVEYFQDSKNIAIKLRELGYTKKIENGHPLDWFVIHESKLDSIPKEFLKEKLKPHWQI